MPNIPATTRSHLWQETAIVEVQVSCTEHDPFATDDSPNNFNDIVWSEKSGSGVILDERHVLTANHVTSCPVIPEVRLGLANGTVRQAMVEKESYDKDVSELVLASTDNFGFGIAPPSIVPSPAIGEPLCLASSLPTRGWSCGNIEEIKDGRVRFGAISKHGNSGSAVYDVEGHLIGIMTDIVKCPDGRPECGTQATLLYNFKF